MTKHNCPVCANSTTDDEPTGWCNRCIGELICIMGWDERFLDAAEWAIDRASEAKSERRARSRRLSNDGVLHNPMNLAVVRP